MNLAAVGEYRALGYSFGIQVDDRLAPSLGGAVRWAFGCLLTSGEDRPEHLYRISEAPGGDGQVVRIERDGEPVRQQVIAPQAPNALMTDINTCAIASRPRHLNVHAGAVSVRGTGVLLAADSGAGKSTLTGALVSAGCGYLTDEAASIDLDTLTVEPYAKPLSLSAHSMEVLGRELSEHGPVDLVPSSWLRAGSCSAAVAPGVLVLPRFEEGAATALTPISRGEALVELANNSFNFVDHGSEWLPRLRDLVAACTCWRLSSGDARDAARLIMEAVR